MFARTRRSFDIAKGTEDSRFFIVAANMAERCDELYHEHSPLKNRCRQCLLAAVSSAVKKIETLDKSQLLELLEVINRFEATDHENTPDATDVMRYLVRMTCNVLVSRQRIGAHTHV